VRLHLILWNVIAVTRQRTELLIYSKEYSWFWNFPQIFNYTDKTEAIINSVTAPTAIENMMQVLKNDSVLLWSYHRNKQSQCCEGVSCCNPTVWLETWWFAIKVCCSVATIEWSRRDHSWYIEGTLENCDFLICRICGLWLLVISESLFYILMVLKMQKKSTFFKEIHNYITLSLSD
jgi:hypothetical protein